MNRIGRRRWESGVTLPELLIVGSVLAALVLLSLPVMKQAGQARRERRLATAAAVLFDALATYQAERGTFPPPGANRPDGFNLRTLAPLTSRGYVRQADSLLALLRGRRVAAYEGGENGFWLLLIDRDQPDIQIVAASTDQFPLDPDTWVEGVFLLRGGHLERLRAERPDPFARRRPEGAREVTGG